MRLIDADALMQTLGITDMDCEKCEWGDYNHCIRGSDFEDACSAIENAPTIESELIRCKDCKYWYDAPASDGYNSCEKDALIRHKDFYCAEAERKEADMRGDT